MGEKDGDWEVLTAPCTPEAGWPLLTNELGDPQVLGLQVCHPQQLVCLAGPGTAHLSVLFALEYTY